METHAWAVSQFDQPMMVHTSSVSCLGENYDHIVFIRKSFSNKSHGKKRVRTCKCFVYVVFTFGETEYYSNTFQVSILLAIHVQGISLWGICPIECRLCSSSPCLCTVVALLIPTVSHWRRSFEVVPSLDYITLPILLFSNLSARITGTCHHAADWRYYLIAHWPFGNAFISINDIF